MKDHRKLRQAPHLVMGELAQQKLPAQRAGWPNHVHVDNPAPRRACASHRGPPDEGERVRWHNAVSEGFRAWDPSG